MPTPSLPTRVTVNITEIDAGGNPLEGRVIFTPSVKSTMSDGTTINTTPVVVRVTAGSAVVNLVATDAPEITPTGWIYRVDKLLGPAGSAGALGQDAFARETFWVSLPAAASPVNLDALTHVDPPPEFHFQVRSVAGVPADANGDVPLTGTDLELSGVGFIGVDSKGAPNGVASLGSDARVPVGQLPDLSSIYLATSRRDAPNGVAGLDGSGLLNPSVLPGLAISDTFTVASQAAMLALTAQRGDIAIRTDLNNQVFILSGSDPTVLGNWTRISLNQLVGTTAGTVAAGDDSRFTSLANRLTAVETFPHARYVNTGTPSIGTGDNILTFPTARATSAQVTASAGFTGFTLTAGLWIIESNWRFANTNLNLEMDAFTGPANGTPALPLVAANALSNWAPQSKSPGQLAIVRFSAATQVYITLYNGSGASQATAGTFGDANHVSFTRLSN